jgi:hypothetical protein
MSTLKAIERAALSLAKGEQRQLLVFLTNVVQNGSRGDIVASQDTVQADATPLHPDLLPMVGIIPTGADAEEIHEYRLLKHS